MRRVAFLPIALLIPVGILAYKFLAPDRDDG
jgi:hypothetical protein